MSEIFLLQHQETDMLFMYLPKPQHSSSNAFPAAFTMATDAAPINYDITKYDYLYKLASHRQVILEIERLVKDNNYWTCQFRKCWIITN